VPYFFCYFCPKKLITAQQIFSIKNQQEFEAIALQIFQFQYVNNAVYRQFCDCLHINPTQITSVEKIPFLPISFFKTHPVVSSQKTIEKVFTSSGTTGAITSQHLVSDVSIYEKSFIKGFENVYGSTSDYVILALLPSYLEREGSSLVYMADALIKKSKNPESGFYLHNYTEIVSKIQFLEQTYRKTLLLGVTYALLDLVELIKTKNIPFAHPNLTIMETGGMKGKRKEMIREELHQILTNGFGVQHIHSEYGMTELLSQAYSKGNGIFETPPWMRVLIRDTEDALTLQPFGKTGGINIIDLANINSCSFIATQDLGKKHSQNTFEVLGRFDNSDIRGCNLMVF